jgi:hypothetical protein
MLNPDYKPMVQLRINHPELQEDIENCVATYRYKIHAEVTNIIDEKIVNAVIETAKVAGYTDLILIDKEFILSAIRHEMEWRKGLR